MNTAITGSPDMAFARKKVIDGCFAFQREPPH